MCSWADHSMAWNLRARPHAPDVTAVHSVCCHSLATHHGQAKLVHSLGPWAPRVRNVSLPRAWASLTEVCVCSWPGELFSLLSHVAGQAFHPLVLCRGWLFHKEIFLVHGIFGRPF